MAWGKCLNENHIGVHEKHDSCAGWVPDENHEVPVTPISAEEFRDSFASTAEQLKEIPGQVISDKVKGSLFMQKADKFWIAAAVISVVAFRDHRLRKRIKNLQGINNVLNLENEFLHAFVDGMVNPKADKRELMTDLATKFQSLSSAKGS